MIARILLVAIAAGVIAGAFTTAAQSIKVIPLIYQAEAYENAAGAQTPAQWAPEDGFQRVAFTLLTNVLTGIGFGLLLTAAIVFAGFDISWPVGALWGIAGFFAFSMLPATGLPPEMPGMIAADISERQIWWGAAVISAITGMALLAFGKGLAFKVLGLGIIAIPHIVGAPHANLNAASSSVPAELAAQYVVATLVTTALFWLVLGALVGGLLQRFGRPA